MKVPMRPPNMQDLAGRLTTSDPVDFFGRIMGISVAGNRYLPWDEIRHRQPPGGLTMEEWWLATKLARNGMQRMLPLVDKDGRRFTYALPDEVLQGIETVNKHTSGRLGVPEPVSYDAPGRERY